MSISLKEAMQTIEKTSLFVIKDKTNWCNFLKTASNNYRQGFSNQLLIFSQIPTATALLSFDKWNERHCFINRGQTSITLILPNGKKENVFDVSQLNFKKSKLPSNLYWKLNKDINNEDIVAKLSETNASILTSDSLDIALQKLSVDTVNNAAISSHKDLICNSINFELRERLDLETDSFFDDNAFDGIKEIKTSNELKQIGKTIKNCFAEIFLKTINATNEVLKDIERSSSYANQQRVNGINGETIYASTGRIRSNEIRISDEVRIRLPKQGLGEIPRDSGTGRKQSSTNDLRGELRGAHSSDRAESIEERKGALPGTDGTKTDEQRSLQRESQTTGNIRTNLHLKSDSKITYDEQTPLLENAEDTTSSAFFASKDKTKAQTVTADKEQLSFFSSFVDFSNEEIVDVLRFGGNTEHLRQMVMTEFSKGKSLSEKVEFLKTNYHGGNGFKHSRGDFSVWFGEDNIKLCRGTNARFDPNSYTLSYEEATNKIEELLDKGEFLTNVEIAEADSLERKTISNKLLSIYHDIDFEKVGDRYLPSLNKINNGRFSYKVEKLSENLKNIDFVDKLIKEYEILSSDYKEDKQIMRFNYHYFDDVLNNIKDLKLPRKEYSSDLTELKFDNQFITDDEIEESILGGTGVERGKTRIYNFFNKNHTSKEKVDFLKDEYGTGGHTSALSNAFRSNENHNRKGITYTKENCPVLNFSWEKFSPLISKLIENGKYQADTLKTDEEEKQPPKEEIKIDNVELPAEKIIVKDENKEKQQTVETEYFSSNENFEITNEHLGEGGAKAKFKANIEAINLLHQLETDERQATKEEQEILSKYVGWGGLSDAFDQTKENWSDEYKELISSLSPNEYESARASTLNAHYTSPVIINAMYEALDNMGFKSGNILEPSCGVGNFFGMLPEKMSDSKLYGVELDSLSGKIAKQLYPKAQINIAGFETTKQKDFYDIAIGNVPFGQYKVNDPAFNKYKFNIHNYFFAKALDEVRPGGIVAFVTSRYTMDSKDNSARKYLAERANLLGAIRLPNDAFKKNAGTEVVSDIIFLQKRESPAITLPNWVDTFKNKDGHNINVFFAENPNMVLGKQTQTSSAHGMEYTVKPFEGEELSSLLSEALKEIKGTYNEVTFEVEGTEKAEITSLPADQNVKNYSYTVVDGDIYFRQDSIMIKKEFNKTATERIKGMVSLRNCVNELINLQMDNSISDVEIKDKQSELNNLYDDFSKKYGLINDRANRLVFDTDSSYYLICALEVLDDDGKLLRKADMFSKRTIKPHKAVTSVNTSNEALVVSISEKASVDMEYMKELTGKTAEQIESDLKGVVFRIPYSENEKGEPIFVTADEYLSGNVRNKLRTAKEAAANDDRFNINVDTLEKAQPKDLDASEIEVRLGATWIDPKYINQFMYETFDTPNYLRGSIDVKYSPITAEWKIENKSFIPNNNIAAFTTYGTNRLNAYKILEDSLNLRDVRVYDTIEEDGKQKRNINPKETTLATQKQQLIRDAFKDWIWRDAERRNVLVKQYNEEMNSTRPREYDGSHIVFGGMNPEIELRQHQKNAVAHILYGGNTLLAHEVGAGKTFEMAAASMESKRLGLCQKSMFVVPNHLTEQWASEFIRLYPSANLLVTTKKDFEPANRKKFCGRIATGDYDAIIIGHSQFEKIPISKERQEKLLEEQINEITEGIFEVKASGGERFTIKQLERTKKNLEDRLEKLQANFRKDDVICFEQLGVDRLFVDESHNYKNLFLYTKMRNVAGLSTSDAQKSSDMFAKCRYMDELTGGKGIIFATGTPVSNSMTELYTIQRYLQYDKLKELGMTHFDCWASRFGETVSALELAPEGTGYRQRTRFSKFYNLPELMNIFKETADIKTSDQLNLDTPEVTFHNVVSKPTEHQQELVKNLSTRAALVHSGSIDPKEDNMLKITSDGRKLGLDQRLINPLLPDEPGTKVNICVDNIFEIWQNSKEDKLTQLVFCDISTPKSTAKKKQSVSPTLSSFDETEINSDNDFNIYDDIKNKLILKGIPKNEIVFIHEASSEAKKKELFAKVRSGQVRVLLGSTSKMGAGTNVQDRLVAIHDLDCPWRPGDLEQRKGRIVRQGNKNKDVHIFRYVTEGTFDAYLWQTVENKQKFISQIMTSKSPVRSCEDVDETALSFAEIKALCAGDPRIKERMDLDVDVSRLKLLKADHQSKLYHLEDRLLKYFPQEIETSKNFIDGFKEDIKTAESNPHPKDEFAGMQIGDKFFIDKELAGKAILDACKDVKVDSDLVIGRYRGFDVALSFSAFENQYSVKLQGKTTHSAVLGTDPRGNITRIDNAILHIPKRLNDAEVRLENLYKQQAAAQEEIGKPFPFEEELRAKQARLILLDTELNMDGKGKEQNIDVPTEKEENLGDQIKKSGGLSVNGFDFDNNDINDDKEDLPFDEWQNNYDDQVQEMEVVNDVPPNHSFDFLSY